MANKNKSCGRLVIPTEDGILPLFSIDDSSESVPAAGYRNGTSLNNAGTNGNYWSSTPNEDDTQNAYNLNFNDGNQSVNWNYRKNGQSVRPVTELTIKRLSDCRRNFSINKDELLSDLYAAYRDARKHKRWKRTQLSFEFNLEKNLIDLRDELLEGRYIPSRSSCFIIHDPKMREVFAAQFRDRIVHHLFYNYVHIFFEKLFIYDSYSCIPGRGTHFGVNRLLHHIRSVSHGYSRPCYVLKFDLQSYFMSIDRTILLTICRKHLRKKLSLPTKDPFTKALKSNIIFVDYLLETIVMDDPTCDCIVVGDRNEWDKLPMSKSLFHSHPGCGLPIGNLSSQLFSNIYLNELDKYIKRDLKCKHYGRYVDDGYIVSEGKEELQLIISKISSFLESELRLKLNWRKTKIYNIYQGVSFLGTYLLPFRRYVDNNTLSRMKRRLSQMKPNTLTELGSTVNSMLGVFSHCDSYCIRKVMFGNNARLRKYGRFSNEVLKYRIS